jgi:transcriptional regulator with XRE-family HTH domain
MNLSDRLRAERERIGLNQADLAAAGRVARRTQVNYETGERVPDAAYLEAISRTGIDVAYVLTGHRSEAHKRTQRERSSAGATVVPLAQGPAARGPAGAAASQSPGGAPPAAAGEPGAPPGKTGPAAGQAGEAVELELMQRVFRFLNEQAALFGKEVEEPLKVEMAVRVYNYLIEEREHGEVRDRKIERIARLVVSN